MYIWKRVKVSCSYVWLKSKTNFFVCFTGHKFQVELVEMTEEDALRKEELYFSLQTQSDLSSASIQHVQTGTYIAMRGKRVIVQGETHLWDLRE